MDAYLNLVTSTFATAAGPAASTSNSGAQQTQPSKAAFSSLVCLSADAHAAIQNDLKPNRKPDNAWTAETLAKCIVNASAQRVEAVVAQRIAAVLRSLLEYVQECPPAAVLANPADRGKGAWLARCGSLDVWTEAQRRWGVLFNRASAVFALPKDSPRYFFAAFRFISSTFLSLSIRLDVLSNQSIRWPHLTDCTARLAGPVRAAGTDRTPLPGAQTRREAAMWLGNDCLRGYFKLNNLKLCETVLKSIREATNRNLEFAGAPSAISSSSSLQQQPTGEEPYGMAERVRYRYYLGRIRLSQGRVRDAFTHLQWALRHCAFDANSPTSSLSQIRRILLHLLPLALVLGIKPSPVLLEMIQASDNYQQQRLVNSPVAAPGSQGERDLEDLYLPLFRAYAKPDMATFDQLLTDRRRKERLRKLGVFLMLQEKSAAGMWRGIVKRCLVLTLPKAPSNPNAPPTLSLALLVKGVLFSQRQQQQSSSSTTAAPSSSSSPATTMLPAYRDVDVECIVASLIDQGYIKGYTFHSKRLLVFQKGPSLGFPRVCDVY